MAQLIVEYFSEEIPARMQNNAAREIEKLFKAELSQARLTCDEITAYTTPRRLTLRVDGLPLEQPDLKSERKGPRTNAPVRAIEGFLGATGLTIDQCETREDKKGSYYVAIIEESGQPAPLVLSDIISRVTTAMSWPKSMRWAGNSFRWVRPLHGIMAVFDGMALDREIDLGGSSIALSNHTRGHRFRAPDEFSVTDFDDYSAKLRTAHVMLDPAERRSEIESTAFKLAADKNFELVDDPALLTEVAGLVEWPTVLLATIDAEFMTLPPEVMRSAMRGHQKYFSLTTKTGEAAPNFIFVANGIAEDSSNQVIAGNERVLRARLSDARHFWDQDRKIALSDRADKLRDIVFHAKLGTLDQRVDRLQSLATGLAKYIPGADLDQVRTAACLAKADLVTEMVGEFPELQGIVGSYYARAEGEDEAITTAIGEHYAPAGPSDRCPTAPVSVAVALAEKLDTLFWLWAYDIRPTGSKDPYALRRATVGIIRLILENELRVDLGAMFDLALETPAGDDEALIGSGSGEKIDEVKASLTEFFADRLKVHLRDRGVPHGHVAAVFALPGEDDLVRIMARIAALSAFLETDDGANLTVAYRRAANIVHQEEKKDGTRFDPMAYDPKLNSGDTQEEAQLWDAFSNVDGKMRTALDKEDYEAAMTGLAQLRAPVDRFFDEVKVNHEDPAIRRNRLNLLARIVVVMDAVAIFNELDG